MVLPELNFGKHRHPNFQAKEDVCEVARSKIARRLGNVVARMGYAAGQANAIGFEQRIPQRSNAQQLAVYGHPDICPSDLKENKSRRKTACHLSRTEARRCNGSSYIPIRINIPAINASAAINTPGIGKAAKPPMPVRISQIANRSIPALRVNRTAIRASLQWV